MSEVGEFSLLSTNQRQDLLIFLLIFSPSKHAEWSFLDPEYSFVAVQQNKTQTRFEKQKFTQLRTNYVHQFVFIGSTNTPKYVHEANVCPIKNGLKTECPPHELQPCPRQRQTRIFASNLPQGICAVAHQFLWLGLNSFTWGLRTFVLTLVRNIKQRQQKMHWSHFSQHLLSYTS